MLPSEPKIFHGRDPELFDILQLFHQNTPRIAILGAGGMGKTSLAQAVIHHPEIVARYGLLRFFVTCDSVTTEVQLAALIGAHLGLESGKDLTRPVFNHLSQSPPTLLILDNFETPWEPRESRGDVEEFLSLLTDAKHLALMVCTNCLISSMSSCCQRLQCEEQKGQPRFPGVDHFYSL
jgi:Cdc6-like AAA superfamily ATPase